MAKVAQFNEPMLYSVDNLLDNEDWGYLYSYSFQNLKRNPKMDEAPKEVKTESESSLESILDLKRESYLALTNAKREKWEIGSKKFCTKLGISAENYEERRAATFFELVLSADTDRTPSLYLGKTHIANHIMEKIAQNSWVFPTLPGINPDRNWPEKLAELYDRICKLNPLSLWAEPFDESLEFQYAGYKLLERMADQAINNTDEAAQVKQWSNLAFLVLFTIILKSGSYDRIVLLIYYHVAELYRFSCNQG